MLHACNTIHVTDCKVECALATSSYCINVEVDIQTLLLAENVLMNRFCYRYVEHEAQMQELDKLKKVGYSFMLCRIAVLIVVHALVMYYHTGHSKEQERKGAVGVQ